MPTLDLSADLPVVGTASDANLIRNGFNAIQAAVNALDNNNIAAEAGISVSKLGQSAALTGQALIWNGSSWAPANPSPGLYRKTTAKQVVNTVAETDLLNGEITIGAGVLGTTGLLRLTAIGDWIQNSGGATDVPRFKLKLGGTTLIDTNVNGGAFISSSAFRNGWRFQALIALLGAANSQWVDFNGIIGNAGTSAIAANAFTTGEGRWSAPLFSVTPGSNFVIYEGGNAGAVDTTLAAALALSVTLPAASATLDVTLKHALVEIL